MYSPLLYKLTVWIGWLPVLLVLLAGIVAALIRLRRHVTSAVLLGVGFAVTLVLILLLLLFYQVGLANLVPPTVVTVIDLLATVGINLFLLLALVGAALGRAPVAEEVS